MNTARLRRSRLGTVTAVNAIVIAAMLSGCAPVSYEYYNALDPSTSATVDEVVATANLDPSIETQLLSEWAGFSQQEVISLSVFNSPVSSVDGLQFFPSLDYLELNDTQLQGVDLSPLRELSNLSQLNLMSNGYTDDSVDEVPYLPQVGWLSLGFNPITDAASVNYYLDEVASDGRTIFLDLQNSQADPGTLSSLNFSALDGLNVASLQDESLNPLTLTDTSFIPADNTLTFIDISGPHAPDLSGLTAASDLRVLYMKDYTAPNLDALPTFERLEQLVVESSGLTSLQGLSQPNLNNLSVEGSTNLADISEITAVGMEDVLGDIDISDTALDDTDMTVVWQMSNLENLRAYGLGAASLTDITGIAALTQLREVILYNNTALTAGLAELAALPNLERVDLNNTGFTDADVQAQTWAPSVFEIVLPSGGLFVPNP
ncbi:MAG TPA: hypothetical protein VJ932_03990 [Alkalispirochaeta sp.]|nr:hypothetical protein [Alkalispirochaeta sp.]